MSTQVQITIAVTGYSCGHAVKCTKLYCKHCKIMWKSFDKVGPFCYRPLPLPHGLYAIWHKQLVSCLSAKFGIRLEVTPRERPRILPHFLRPIRMNANIYLYTWIHTHLTTTMPTVILVWEKLWWSFSHPNWFLSDTW